MGKAWDEEPRVRAREAIREFVRFSAAHPEFFRLMVDEGKNTDDRMRWLVDTHLKPRYARFAQSGSSCMKRRACVAVLHRSSSSSPS